MRGLAGRGLINATFLRELRDLHRKDNASYYGGIIWVLVMLELWFRHHVDQSAPEPASPD
jgi:asparagine synthase (glutamine-hydrolysing)